MEVIKRMAAIVAMVLESECHSIVFKMKSDFMVLESEFYSMFF